MIGSCSRSSALVALALAVFAEAKKWLGTKMTTFSYAKREHGISVLDVDIRAGRQLKPH